MQSVFEERGDRRAHLIYRQVLTRVIHAFFGKDAFLLEDLEEILFHKILMCNKQIP